MTQEWLLKKASQIYIQMSSTQCHASDKNSLIKHWIFFSSACIDIFDEYIIENVIDIMENLLLIFSLYPPPPPPPPPPPYNKVVWGYIAFTPSICSSVCPSVRLSICPSIKPPKAACQFAADDILLYEFCYYNPMDLLCHLERRIVTITMWGWGGGCVGISERRHSSCSSWFRIMPYCIIKLCQLLSR